MGRLTAQLAATLLLIGFWLPAAAQIGLIPGTEPIAPVYEQSDVVCLCVIQSVSISAGKPAADFATSKIIRRQVILQAETRRVYKSDRGDAREFLIQYTEDVGIASPAQTFLKTGDFALLFLKATSPTTYEFADRFMGATRFSVLPGAPNAGGLSGLETDLAFLTRTQVRQDSLSALRLLQAFDSLSPATSNRVDSLASSRDPEIAFSALAVLLKASTPSAVEKLRRYLEVYKGNAEPIALVSIGAEIGEIRDQDALPAIEALASSRYLAVRYGALQSLRKMRNPQSAPVIVERLDDPDHTNQYIAMITLAEIFGKYEGDYAPSMYLFDKKPQYYISLWKQWWEQEGKSRYATKPND